MNGIKRLLPLVLILIMLVPMTAFAGRTSASHDASARGSGKGWGKKNVYHVSYQYSSGRIISNWWTDRAGIYAWNYGSSWTYYPNDANKRDISSSNYHVEHSLYNACQDAINTGDFANSTNAKTPDSLYNLIINSFGLTVDGSGRVTYVGDKNHKFLACDLNTIVERSWPCGEWEYDYSGYQSESRNVLLAYNVNATPSNFQNLSSQSSYSTSDDISSKSAKNLWDCNTSLSIPEKEFSNAGKLSTTVSYSYITINRDRHGTRWRWNSWYENGNHVRYSDSTCSTGGVNNGTWSDYTWGDWSYSKGNITNYGPFNQVSETTYPAFNYPDQTPITFTSSSSLGSVTSVKLDNNKMGILDNNTEADFKIHFSNNSFGVPNVENFTLKKAKLDSEYTLNGSAISKRIISLIDSINNSEGSSISITNPNKSDITFGVKSIKSGDYKLTMTNHLRYEALVKAGWKMNGFTITDGGMNGNFNSEMPNGNIQTYVKTKDQPTFSDIISVSTAGGNEK